MDVLTDLHNLEDELDDVKIRLNALREQNGKDFVKLVESTDATLLSKDREQLEDLLDSSNGNLRCAALCLLEMRNWTSNVVIRCPSLAISDPDPNVRGVAVLMLPKLHADLGKPLIITLLTQIVLNSHEQTMIRQAAFRALLDIKGVGLLSKQRKDFLQGEFPSSAVLDYAKSCIPPQQSS